MENCDIPGSKREQMLSLFLEKPCKIDTIFTLVLLTGNRLRDQVTQMRRRGTRIHVVWVSVVLTAMPLLLSLTDWPLSVDHRYPND